MAAVGDIYEDFQSVANNDYLDTAPGVGEEASIHNIYWGGAVTIEKYDGANSIIFRTEAAAGGLAYYAFFVTETRRIRIKNTSGGPIYIAYDGIYTRV